MPKYKVYVEEELLHIHIVEAPNEDALDEMVFDLPPPIESFTTVINVLHERTIKIEED
jgi:hypothetical protein